MIIMLVLKQRANVVRHSVHRAVQSGTIRFNVIYSSYGKRSVTMIQKHIIGFMPIQKNVQNVKLQLKKMADVIMLYVEIRFERHIFSNFMTKFQSCRYEFCWVCLAAWSSHGSTFYNCNRYNEAEGADARQQQENSRAALERYLFYYNRYHNHAQSLKKEGKLQKCVQKKMKVKSFLLSLSFNQFSRVCKSVKVWICRGLKFNSSEMQQMFSKKVAKF